MSMTRKIVIGGAAVLAALLCGAAPGSAAAGGPLLPGEDPYEAALATARGAEAAGDLATAIRALSEAMPRYQQDVEIPLQLAWLLYRSNRFVDAELTYRMALSRGATDGKAQLGLGYTLIRLGRCAEAVTHFRAAAATPATQGGAAEGLRQCATPSPAASEKAPRLWIQPQFAQGIYLYGGNSVVRNTLATAVRAEALLYGHYYLAAGFRYSHFSTEQGTVSAWNQNEGYFDAGYTAQRAGVTLHYAVVDDESGDSGVVSHLGITGRYSPVLTSKGSLIGDAIVRLSASFYHDAPVLRGELAWRMPLYAGLSARPSAALQWTPSETFRTVSLLLGYDHRLFSVWAGGKYGDEFRAAYLDFSFIYSSHARTLYGALAGIAARPGARVAVALSYAFDHLQRTDITPALDSPVHYLTFSISKEF